MPSPARCSARRAGTGCSSRSHSGPSQRMTSPMRFGVWRQHQAGEADIIARMPCPGTRRLLRQIHHGSGPSFGAKRPALAGLHIDEIEVAPCPARRAGRRADAAQIIHHRVIARQDEMIAVVDRLSEHADRNRSGSARPPAARLRSARRARLSRPARPRRRARRGPRRRHGTSFRSSDSPLRSTIISELRLRQADARARRRPALRLHRRRIAA